MGRSKGYAQRRELERATMSENRLKESANGQAATLTAEDAVKFLQDQQRASLTACDRELAEVLQRHGCRLVATPSIVNGLIVAEVQIVPAK